MAPTNGPETEDTTNHAMFVLRKPTAKRTAKKQGTSLFRKRGTEESKKHAKRQAGVKLTSETALGKTAPE